MHGQLKQIKVFISYSRESKEHLDKVLALADKLETLGIEAVFDQYDPNPAQGWTQWMQHGIRESDFVICVCTESYRQKVEDKMPAGTGLGLQWEGSLIYNALQSQKQEQAKFQVVQFDSYDIGTIPTPLTSSNRHCINRLELEDEGFEALYRILTDQPKALRPKRGELVHLDAITRSQIPRTGLQVTEFQLQKEATYASRENQRSANIVPSTKRIPPPKGAGPYLQRVANALIDMAFTAVSQEDYRSAIALVLQAESIDRKHRLPLKHVAQWYRVLHDYSESLYWFQRASEAGYDFSEDFDYLAAPYLAGKSEPPLALGEKLFSRIQKTGLNYVRYADFLSAMGQEEEAISLLSEYTGESDRFDVQMDLAIKLWFRGDASQSIAIFDVLPKEEFSSSDWLNYGVGLAELHRFGLAIEAIKEGVTKNRKSQFALFALAQIYAQMGEVETCVANLEKLLDQESHYLRRVPTERTLDPVRNTENFQGFLVKLESFFLLERSGTGSEERG